MKQRVTGADVAKAAGVSRATVSYVLNDTAGQSISADTQRRVRAAAKRLGYVPSMAGRTLRRGHSDLVIWVLPDWPIGAEVGKLIESLTREAGLRGFTLAVVQEGHGATPLATTIRTLAPAAIIAMHEMPRSLTRIANDAGVPIATHWHGTASTAQPALPHFARQSWHVGAAQVRHLVERGHTRLAYLFPDDPRLHPFAEHRLAGARDAARALGIPGLRRRTVALDRSRMGDVARSWHAVGITGVASYNDEWAMALLSGMHLMGLDAPEDLAVIGCDNILTAPVASPPLTTIDQDVAVSAVNIMNDVQRALGQRPLAEDIDHPLARVVVRVSA